MDEQSQRTALLSALTTEHFVLQSATSTTYSEASARSTLYVMALSSSLVAMGFLSGSAEVLIPFALIVLPTVFLLGIFTVVRLVETGLESMHYLDGIARIRAYYRTLGPDAARHFAPEHGRWPEVESPALRLGSHACVSRHNRKHDRGHQQRSWGHLHRASHSLTWPLRTALDGCCRWGRRCIRAHLAVLCIPALALPRV